jgi:hypothetical protein
MDIDETDLLATNSFISQPVLEDIPVNRNAEFRDYYLREQELREESAINKIIELDPNEVVTGTKNVDNDGPSSIFRERISIISVDSRDRDRLLYPKPNDFKIFLGRTFYNIRQVKLVSLEFPNTDAVINSSNYGIYWRNLEDIERDIIDDITGDYPIYNTNLRIGSYTLATIQTEMKTKLGVIKRRNGTDDFHYFVVKLDFETDISTLTSLYLQQLNNDPITTISGSGLIKITTPDPHGLTTGDSIYLISAKTTNGIISTDLNGEHIVNVISNTQFTFEITVAAIAAGSGGGNTCKIGKSAPYQLLFGDYQNTVASNLGFPLENSSQRIDTPFSKITRFFQVKLTTIAPHNLIKNFNTIGQIVNITGASGLSGNFFLTNILDSTNILVNVPSQENTYNYNSFVITRIANSLGQVKLTIATPHGLIPGDQISIFNTNSSPNMNGSFTVIDVPNSTELILDDSTVISQIGSFGYISNAFFVFNGNLFPILTSSNYQEQIEITTSIEHNYDFTDIGNTFIIYNTTTTPQLDGESQIVNITSPTSLIIGGTILANKIALGTEDVGRTPRHNVINTFTFKIVSVSIIGNFVRFETDTPHTLQLNDSIQVINLQSVPNINGVTFKITSIPTPTSFQISTSVSSISVTETSTLLTGLIKLSFPSHSFNQIISIIKNGVDIEIITKTPHKLNTGDKIRISGSDSVPSIDSPAVSGSAYTVTKINDTTFSIPLPFFLIGLPWTDGSFGVIGMSNDFNLYGVSEVGGLPPSVLNNKHTVREVLDENSFTIYIQNIFATSSANGGGTVFISSLRHGFNGVQNNTKNGILYRSINLEGENYCFLTCPTLGTIMNTGKVQNIFARISLTESPGAMIFNQYNSTPKVFEESLLPELNELSFSIVNYNNTLYDFNDLDYSFTLEITEIVEQLPETNVSARTGGNNFRKIEK